MPRRYDPASEAVPAFHLRLGTALIASLRNGYGARDLRADLLHLDSHLRRVEERPEEHREPAAPGRRDPEHETQPEGQDGGHEELYVVVRGAARFFALPSLVSNGTPPIKLETRAQARARIGYVSQKFALYGNLTVETTGPTFSFFGSVYGLADITARKTAELKLQANEQRLVALTAQAPGVVFQSNLSKQPPKMELVTKGGTPRLHDPVAFANSGAATSNLFGPSVETARALPLNRAVPSVPTVAICVESGEKSKSVRPLCWKRAASATRNPLS